MNDPTEGLELIPASTDLMYTTETVRTLADREANSLNSREGYDIRVSPIDSDRRFCITLNRNHKMADLWIEVTTNLGGDKGEVKRKLALIATTTLDPIKTPVGDPISFKGFSGRLWKRRNRERVVSKTKWLPHSSTLTSLTAKSHRRISSTNQGDAHMRYKISRIALSLLTASHRESHFTFVNHQNLG